MAARRLQRSLWVLAFLALAFFGARTFVGDVYHVSSQSMEPTIRAGEWVFVRYSKQAPRRNELVVFRRDGEAVVKRVAALPGESVTIEKTGDLYIDAQVAGRVAPRPAPIVFFDPDVHDFAGWFVQNDASLWTTGTDGGLELDARSVAPDSDAGLVCLQQPLRDEYVRRSDRAEHQVADAILELELQPRSGQGVFRMQLLEEADTFEARLSLADGALELVRRNPDGEETLKRAQCALTPNDFTRLTFANVDNELRFECAGTPVASVRYERNVHRTDMQPGQGLSTGRRVKFGASAAQVSLRAVRILRDLHYTQRGEFARHRPAEIGPGQLFVLGDHSARSRDSREWGPIEASSVIGRAAWVVWPPKAFRRLGEAP